MTGVIDVAATLKKKNKYPMSIIGSHVSLP